MAKPCLLAFACVTGQCRSLYLYIGLGTKRSKPNMSKALQVLDTRAEMRR